MKTLPQKILNFLKWYWRDILSFIGWVIFSLVIFAFGFFLCVALVRDELIYLESMVESPEPEVCVLCRNGEGAKIHAPCIVNLSTGEVAELSVYESHPTEPGEVSTELKKGYFSFSVGLVHKLCVIRIVSSAEQRCRKIQGSSIRHTSVMTADEILLNLIRMDMLSQTCMIRRMCPSTRFGMAPSTKSGNIF